MTMLRDSAEEIREFKYAPSGVAAPSGWEQAVLLHIAQPVPSSSEDPFPESPDESRARELETAFEQGRKQGVEEGRRLERLEKTTRVEQDENRRNEQIKRICEQYTLGSDQLLRAIEPQVVKLALRVAERIVRREVQVDPLVLTGAVRAALGQLADDTTIRVRVPAVDAELWSETLAHLPNLRIDPEVTGDAQLRPGECMLECDCGVADLGIETQLQGIARGVLGERETRSKVLINCESSGAEETL